MSFLAVLAIALSLGSWNDLITGDTEIKFFNILRQSTEPAAGLYYENRRFARGGPVSFATAVAKGFAGVWPRFRLASKTNAPNLGLFGADIVCIQVSSDVYMRPCAKTGSFGVYTGKKLQLHRNLGITSLTRPDVRERHRKYFVSRSVFAPLEYIGAPSLDEREYHKQIIDTNVLAILDRGFTNILNHHAKVHITADVIFERLKARSEQWSKFNIRLGLGDIRTLNVFERTAVLPDSPPKKYQARESDKYTDLCPPFDESSVFSRIFLSLDSPDFTFSEAIRLLISMLIIGVVMRLVMVGWPFGKAARDRMDSARRFAREMACITGVVVAFWFVIVYIAPA